MSGVRENALQGEFQIVDGSAHRNADDRFSALRAQALVRLYETDGHAPIMPSA